MGDVRGRGCGKPPTAASGQRSATGSVIRPIGSDRNGSVAIMTALLLPVVILSLGLGIDYGALTLQRRGMQALADTASMMAAANPTRAALAVAEHMEANHAPFAVLVPDGYLLPGGQKVVGETPPAELGIARIETGTYNGTAATAPDKRFLPAPAGLADAARVRLDTTGTMHIAGHFLAAPRLGVTGTAARQKTAAFSVGTRLASLDSGIVNALLGALLGGSVSLKAMDYERLLGADIKIAPLLDRLATQLKTRGGEL